MKNAFNQSNLPFLLLILFIGKTFFLNVSVFDSIAIVSLSLLFGFKLYLDHIRKPDFSQVVLDEFIKIRKEVEFKINELDTINKARLVEFDTKVSTLNLAVTSKKSGGSNEFKWG